MCDETSVLTKAIIEIAGVIRVCPKCGKTHVGDDQAAVSRAYSMGIAIRDREEPGFRGFTDDRVHHIINRAISDATISHPNCQQ